MNVTGEMNDSPPFCEHSRPTGSDDDEKEYSGLLEDE